MDIEKKICLPPNINVDISENRNYHDIINRNYHDIINKYPDIFFHAHFVLIFEYFINYINDHVLNKNNMANQ